MSKDILFSHVGEVIYWLFPKEYGTLDLIQTDVKYEGGVQMLGNLSAILQKYKENMNRQSELDEMLLKDLEKEEWISCLQNRATENQAMYQENGELIQQLEALLVPELTVEEAELLYQEA